MLKEKKTKIVEKREIKRKGKGIMNISPFSPY
jgi:hypothetical protein